METIIRETKNSSGKIIGYVKIEDNIITIHHNTKPEVIITDQELIDKIKDLELDSIKILYDEYYLNTAEIAALYNMPYSTMNRIFMPQFKFNTTAYAGRRNSRYGAIFSEETRAKIGKASKGRKNSGQYVRTPEIKEKISKSLKEYYNTHEVSIETRQKLSQAWTDGKYKNSPMGIGIHGYCYSIKNNKNFYFRSLLELFYLLKLEEDKNVSSYDMEPFQIAIDNIHHYTPDFLINKKDIKELKTSKHLQYTNDAERFQQEIQAATEYAKQNNMTFEVIYDTDLGFETRAFKKWLLTNPDIITQYQITFERDIFKWL